MVTKTPPKYMVFLHKSTTWKVDKKTSPQVMVLGLLFRLHGIPITTHKAAVTKLLPYGSTLRAMPDICPFIDAATIVQPFIYESL